MREGQIKDEQVKDHKVVHLERIWKARRKADVMVAIPKDIKRIAIEKRESIARIRSRLPADRPMRCKVNQKASESQSRYLLRELSVQIGRRDCRHLLKLSNYRKEHVDCVFQGLSLALQ